MSNNPFTPGATVSAASSGSSSAAVALPKSGLQGQVRVASAGGGTQTTAFIKFGDSAVAATTSDTPILAGSTQIFTPPTNATHFAVIASAATTVYVTCGFGE